MKPNSDAAPRTPREVAWSQPFRFGTLAMAVVESGILGGVLLWVQLTHHYAGIRASWFLFAFVQIAVLGTILYVAARRRIEVGESGILSTLSGGFVRRFVPWTSVKAYRIYPPNVLSLEVQHDVEVWGTDGDVLEIVFPEAKRDAIEAIVRERVHTGM